MTAEATMSQERLVIMNTPEIPPEGRADEFRRRRAHIREEGGFEELLANADPVDGPPRHSSTDGHRATTVTQWMFIWSLTLGGAGIAAIWLMGVLA